MCKYCEEMSLECSRLLRGKNLSETNGDIFIELVQNKEIGNMYYISCDCFEHHHSESYTINYCPMCGRNLKEEQHE